MRSKSIERETEFNEKIENYSNSTNQHLYGRLIDSATTTVN